MPKKLLAASAALVLAGLPAWAAAKPPHPPHPNHPAKPPHPNKPTPPGQARKCRPHAVAYKVAGTLVSSSLTLTPAAHGHPTASGPISITVTSANKHARNAGVTVGSTQNYTLTNAKATYAHKLTQPNPPPGTRTGIKGTITVVAKKCTNTTGTGVVMILHVGFTPRKH